MNINERDKENGQKVEEASDIIHIASEIEKDKYTIKIYSSKDNSTIIFKVEQENIQTFYFYEKFDLRDFKQQFKKSISDENIQDVFTTLKHIIEKCSTKLEKKPIKMNITFLNKSETIASFSLRKKLVSQNRLNPLLVEQITENKTKLKELKKQAKKFDKSIQNQNDVIANINSKIDIINNSIKNIINDINSINKKKLNNDIKEINKKESNNNINNKNITLDEQKDDYNCTNYKSAINKLNKKNNFLFLLNTIIFLFIIYYCKYCNRINDGIFNKDKIKEEKLLKIISFFDYIEQYDSKQLEYLESNLKNFKDIKDNNIKDIKHNRKPNYIIDKFKSKLKNATDNIKIPIINLINDDKESERIDPNIKSKKSSESIKEINDSKSDSKKNENINELKEKANKINEIKNSTKYDQNKTEKYLLENDDEINYFKNVIKQKAKYKIKDVNLILKYKSDDLSYSEFYNNCKSISENLIVIKNQEGKKAGIISKNIIGILNKIFDNKKISNEKNDFIGYMFDKGSIEELIFPEFFGVYEAFISIFKEIYIFLNKENQLNDGVFLNNLKENHKNYFGELETIEIYQIKYIIK